ncbi:hypothetical protein JCM10213v2_004307 [Rhodosporidiobolus nylandii]
MGSFASSLAGAASTSSSSAHPAGSFVPEYEDVQAALRLLTDGLNLPPELALLTLDLAEYHPVLRATSNIPRSQPVVTHRPILTARLHSNLHASRQFSTFTLSFIAAPPPPSTSSDPSAPFDDPAEVEGDDHDAPQHVVDRAELVRQARAGDRIAVVARAEYPAWVNAVAACEVRVQVRAV